MQCSMFNVRNFSIKTWITIKIKIKTRHLVFIVHRRFKFFYLNIFPFPCQSRVSKWNAWGTKTHAGLTMERKTILPQQNHHQVTNVMFKSIKLYVVLTERRERNSSITIRCWLLIVVEHLTKQLNQSFGRALSVLHQKRTMAINWNKIDKMENRIAFQFRKRETFPDLFAILSFSVQWAFYFPPCMACCTYFDTQIISFISTENCFTIVVYYCFRCYRFELLFFIFFTSSLTEY